MKKTAAQIADYVLRKVAEDLPPLLGTRKPARVGLIDPAVERAREQAAAKERANRILEARQAPRAGVDTPPTAPEGYEVVPKPAPLAYKQDKAVEPKKTPPAPAPKVVPPKNDELTMDPLGNQDLGDIFSTAPKPPTTLAKKIPVKKKQK